MNDYIDNEIDEFVYLHDSPSNSELQITNWSHAFGSYVHFINVD